MKSIAILLFITAPGFLMAQLKDFREDFNDNRNNWWTGSDEFYEGRIENGYYELSYLSKESPEKNIWVIKDKIIITKPWDIEARIKVISLEGTQNSFGLTIGELDRGNSHYYILCPALRMTWWYDYRMYKQTVIKNEPLPLKIFDADDSITGTKIYLKQRDGNIYFYVNDVFMNKVASPKTWNGSGIGLFVNTGSVLRMDYLEIKQKDILIN